MLWRHLLNGAGVSLLVFLAVLIWTEREGAWLAFWAAVVAFVVANLEVVKYIKVSATGIEAETGEVIRDARDTLRELRNLAKEFAGIFIVMLNAEGRFGGGLSTERKTVVTERILSVLGGSGLKDDEVEAVRAEERPFVLFDYASHISSNFKKAHWKEFTTEQHRAWNAFRNRKGIGHEASADELERFFESLTPLTAEQRELIEDYRYYELNTRHRRPDVWERRREWG
jgi:hypothetical protein